MTKAQISDEEIAFALRGLAALYPLHASTLHRAAERIETVERDRHSPDEIRAINQAAAVFDGVMYLGRDEQASLALQLFAIAGNPMPADARAHPDDQRRS